MSLVESNRMQAVQSVFRFAPSPNGYLHLGHAYSALLNQDLADRARGALLLRMEDIDRARCREDYAIAIEDDLRWLGVKWKVPVRRQSDHFSHYASLLEGLVAQDLAFPCFCTRGGIQAAVAAHSGWPADPDGAPLYPGTCKALSRAERTRQLAVGRPAAYRLDMAAALTSLPGPLDWLEFGGSDGVSRMVEAEPARWGDALIGRKDVPTSYHLAVVADDAAQRVTDVVRGLDLFAATGLQRVLQTLLGLPAPRYHHHRLILDEAGQKLSKSRQAPSLRALRLAGWARADVRRRLHFA